MIYTWTTRCLLTMYTKSNSRWLRFLADFSGRSSTIQNSVTTGMGWQQSVEALAESRMIERIVVMGVTKAPASIDVGGEALGFTFDSNSKFLVIRKPGVSALADWQIKITF